MIFPRLLSVNEACHSGRILDGASPFLILVEGQAYIGLLARYRTLEYLRNAQNAQSIAALDYWYVGYLDMEKAGPQRSVQKIHGAASRKPWRAISVCMQRTPFDPAIPSNGILAYSEKLIDQLKMYVRVSDIHQSCKNPTQLHSEYE